MEEHLLTAGYQIDNRFELENELGEGGMSEVWKAWDLRAHTFVAVKIFKPDSAEEEPADRRRFLGEARALIQVNHDNVVSVVDVGVLPDGRPYIAMELIEGETLEQYLARRGRLGTTEAQVLLIPIASAVAAVHQANIIHRDLKPTNIMLLPTAAGVVIPKVLDFGIAKILHPDERRLTRTGRSVGTPDYMSPQRLRGEPASPADDIFSLGAIAYQMITGDTPFHGDRVEVVIGKIISPEPPLPINPPAQPPLVHPLVEQTIMRALEKDRAKRFATMEEMLQALRGWPTEAPVSTPTRTLPAPPAPPAPEPGRWTLKPGDIAVDPAELALATWKSAQRRRSESGEQAVATADIGQPMRPSPVTKPDHDWLGTGEEPSLTTEPRRRLSTSHLATEEPRLPWSKETRHTFLVLLMVIIAVATLALFGWHYVNDAIDYWQSEPPPAPVLEATPPSSTVTPPPPPTVPPKTKATRPEKPERSPPAGKRK